MAEKLQIVIDVDGGKATTTLNKVEKATKDVGDQSEKSSKGVKSLSGALGQLAVGAAAVKILKDITVAGMEMQTIMNTLQVATGDAAASMEFVRGEAERLGLDLESTAKAYAKFSAAARGSALEGEQADKVFTSIATASTAMGLSAEQSEGALRALEQMMSKGNVQAEELRGQLGERLPGAFNLAAKAMGVTTQELNKMLENGDVLASDMLPKLADVLVEEFGDGADSAAHNARQELARLGTAMFELKDAIATSGVLDAVAELARTFTDGAKEMTQFYTVIFGNAPLLEKNADQINALNKEIGALEKDIKASEGSGSVWKRLFGDYDIEKEKLKLAALKEELKAYTQARQLILEGDGEGSGTSGKPKPKPKPKPTETKAEKAKREREAARREADMITAYQHNADRIQAAQDYYDELALMAEQVAMDDEMRAIDAFDKELNLIEENRAMQVQNGVDEVAAEEEANKAKEDAEKIHLEKISKIRKDAGKEDLATKKKTDKMIADADKQRLSLTAGALSAASDLLAASGEGAFQASKAFAIAETVVSTYSAAQKAYESQLALPTPDAPARAAIAAGIAIAGGLARVAAIASTSSSSSSVSATSTGGSTPTASATTSSVPEAPATTTDTTQTSAINVVVEGGSVLDANFAADLADQLAGPMEQAFGNNRQYQVNV